MVRLAAIYLKVSQLVEQGKLNKVGGICPDGGHETHVGCTYLYVLKKIICCTYLPTSLHGSRAPTDPTKAECRYYPIPLGKSRGSLYRPNNFLVVGII